MLKRKTSLVQCFVCVRRRATVLENAGPLLEKKISLCILVTAFCHVLYFNLALSLDKNVDLNPM